MAQKPVSGLSGKAPEKPVSIRIPNTTGNKRKYFITDVIIYNFDYINLEGFGNLQGLYLMKL
ncbi:hypothetical protein D1164_05625 [Mariniphaga sediminis]|uniref:Uncharacterized protein n=1 Tax=Mariniphaga sediminis TaxID=1628158 RepID=A0A399D3C2_9BACT|nr:hypothetical protein D1164_05625 [Mariniphaga sediminis]